MKNFKYFKKHCKGSVAIYFTLLILIIITIISLGWGAVMINQIKISREMGFAAPAYYAAEAGVEKGLYQVRYNKGPVYNGGSGNNEVTGTLSSGATYKVEWDGDNAVIGTGSYEGTNRTIKAEW